MAPDRRPRGSWLIAGMLAAAAAVGGAPPSDLAATASARVVPGPSDGVAADAGATAFAPVGPCRLTDTRNGLGVQWLDSDTIRVHVRGRCGTPDAAVAAALTLTVADTGSAGFLTAWPAGEPRPEVSNVNWRAAETRSNSAVVRLGAEGAVDVFLTGPAALVVDVTGALAPADAATAGRFVPVGPVRVVDTRGGAAPPPGSTLTVPLPAGVPADATALAVNVTAAGAGQPGFVTAWPAGAAMPEASVLNTDRPDQTRAATAIVPVSPGGLVLYCSGGGHVIVDVSGYFTGPSAPASSDGLFVPLDPSRRVYDSRREPAGRLTVGTTQRVGVGVTGAAIVANWTLVDAENAGFLALRAAGTAWAPTSDVNATIGETVANLAVTAISELGVDAFTRTAAHLIADLQGYLTGVPLTSAPLPFGGVARGDGRFAGPRHPDGRYRVLYVGDSMARDSADALRVALAGWVLDERTFGGTAPCDWLDGDAADAATLLEPDYVVVSFLGNNCTPCAAGASGEALLAQYRRDLTALCDQTGTGNCVLVGQAPLPAGSVSTMPPGEPTPSYRALAGAHGWWFVDAGAAVEDPNGGYVPAWRGPDGVHFSQDGAVRYAGAIAAFLTAIGS